MSQNPLQLRQQQGGETKAHIVQQQATTAASAGQQQQQQLNINKKSNTPLPSWLTNMKEHVEHILSLHITGSPVKPRECTGGFLPVCRDPKTGLCYFNFGINWKSKACHYHGWTDHPEIYIPRLHASAQGAAREAWEESKACLIAAPHESSREEKLAPPTTALGRLKVLVDLYRASMCAPYFSQVVGRGCMHLVFLGDMTEQDRTDYCVRFSKAKHWNNCSNEVSHMRWVEAKTLRENCLKRTDIDPDVVIWKADLKTEDANPLQKRKEKLRDWLGKNLSDPAFWEIPILREIVDEGTVPLFPLHAFQTDPRFKLDWSVAQEHLPFAVEKNKMIRAALAESPQISPTAKSPASSNDSCGVSPAQTPSSSGASWVSKQ